MKRTLIKSILAYAEADDTEVLKYAAHLAGRMHARLEIVDILDEVHVKVMMSASADLATLVRDAKQRRLDKIAARLSKTGVKVHGELLEGHPETAVVRRVLKGGHDLLVIPSAEKAGRQLTTTGMRLLRKCPCPVWVAGRERSGRKLKIVAAVDALPDDLPRARLNARVLNLADSVARQCDGELHVLNAWEAFGETMLRGARLGAREADVESYVSQTELDHRAELAALWKRTRITVPDDHVHLIKGDAGEVIPKFCKKQKVDVLVLGTIARTGIGAALIGNTAEAVVSRLACSVLAIKPEAFKSPVLP